MCTGRTPAGVFHFLKYDRVPYGELMKNLVAEKDMYSLEPLLGKEAPQGDRAHRAEDFDENDIPDFIPRKELRSSNLYIGPGGNKTLLHYDEVHSFLIMVEGSKRCAVFRPDQTRYLYPYHAFDIRSILESRVLDSKINPLEIDLDRFPKIPMASCQVGMLHPGQALFLPAGFWHYIDSSEPNISVNYFWRNTNSRNWLERPLLDFWFKQRQIDLLESLRAVKYAWSRRAGQRGD